MKNLVILTGSGISAESGLKTFRDSDGLWNNHNIYEVATPEAWQANPQLVMDFYNHRRAELRNAEPNEAHSAIVELETCFNTQIITQNVDNLHERAGSSNVLHLHGELTKVRGENSFDTIEDIGYRQLALGEKSIRGDQLRPHIVWFGEDVPLIMNAVDICQTADVFVVIGTSLQVYPAAGLLSAIPNHCPVYLIDPKASELNVSDNVTIINDKAGIGVPALVKMLCKM